MAFGIHAEAIRTLSLLVNFPSRPHTRYATAHLVPTPRNITIKEYPRRDPSMSLNLIEAPTVPNKNGWQKTQN